MKKVIRFVSLEIEGCVYTNACANAVAQLAEGRTIDQALAITPEHVANYLETLPHDSFHCAELAVSALVQAVLDYKRKPITNH
jgi:nitrogen fixation NifU-like protein